MIGTRKPAPPAPPAASCSAPARAVSSCSALRPTGTTPSLGHWADCDEWISVSSRRGAGSYLSTSEFDGVVLVAPRQARPRGADGMGRPGRPLRRFTRRCSSQRDEFHLEANAPPCNKLRCTQQNASNIATPQFLILNSEFLLTHRSSATNPATIGR